MANEIAGYADLHAHLMADLAYGGRVFSGKPFPSGDMAENAMEAALPHCDAAHGTRGEKVGIEDAHATGGYPEFDGWPRFSSTLHQKAYVDWVHRAYAGGLRLVSCLAVNNKLLAERFGSDGPTDDKHRYNLQFSAMKQMVDYVDGVSGGAGAGWMQIAQSSTEAREIIRANKLAVILGIEATSLGNWLRPSDLPSDLTQARREIRAEIARLFKLGVRQIAPIHVTDNAFGGTAVYNYLFDALNVHSTDRHFEIRDASASGVRYRLDEDRGTTGMAAEVARYLSQEVQPTTWRSTPGGHANAKGLSPYGRIALEEMMRYGMIIDIDHFSERSVDDALNLLEEYDYPVICSHTGFRELAFTASQQFSHLSYASYGTSDVHKIANELLKRPRDLERIRALGGVVAPILNQGDIQAWGNMIPNDCPGSSKTWAQAYLYAIEKMHGRGVALGSDINGLLASPGPRFGTYAAFRVAGDQVRQHLRSEFIDLQDRGVSYSEPIHDYRRWRWEGDGYSPIEACIWRGIILGLSRRDVDNADLSDSPENEAAIIRGVARGVKDNQSGRTSTTRTPARIPLSEEGKIFELAASRALSDSNERVVEPADTPLRQAEAQIFKIWRQYLRTLGSNRPLLRSAAGQRDFDFNFDGLTHYGMLPDFIQDLRNLGMTDRQLEPLMRSAADYADMWDKCEARAKAINKSLNT